MRYATTSGDCDFSPGTKCCPAARYKLLLRCALQQKCRVPFVKLIQKALLVLHAANAGKHSTFVGILYTCQYNPAGITDRSGTAFTLLGHFSKKKCIGQDCWGSFQHSQKRGAVTPLVSRARCSDTSAGEKQKRWSGVFRMPHDADLNHCRMPRSPISTFVRWSLAWWGLFARPTAVWIRGVKVKQAASDPGRCQGLYATDRVARTLRQRDNLMTRRAAGQENY